MSHLGEIAALTTAICWSLGSIFFGFAGRRVGPLTVNVLRIPMAAIWTTSMVLITSRTVLPEAATGEQYALLALSALVGLVIGDSCYFPSLVILGPRLATLLSASTPVFAVILSWIFLDQELGPVALLGISVTLAGTIWVTFEKGGSVNGIAQDSKSKGILLGLIASLCQAVGLVITKEGMGETIAPLTASMIRMISATLLIWVIAMPRGRVRQLTAARHDKRALWAIVAASLVGPFIGVWFSLISIQHTQIGIASTLMATTPILVIPLVRVIHSERSSLRTIIGTLVAVGGIAILFLR